MEVTEQDVDNVRRIAESVFGDVDSVKIKEVKDNNGDIMVKVEAVGGNNFSVHNAFGGKRLKKFYGSGYIAVAVAGGTDRHSARFERADAVEFGGVGPKDEYDLVDDWSVTVGTEYAVLKHDGSVTTHVMRDGWELDEYVLHKVLPSKVTQSLKDAGFEEGDVEL